VIRIDHDSSTQHIFVPTKIAEPRQRFLVVRVAQPTNVRAGQGSSTRQTFLLVREAQPHRDSHLFVLVKAAQLDRDSYRSRQLNPTDARTGHSQKQARGVRV
jgi:hypothetical protein